MSDEATIRIDRIEKRVDRLEDQYRADVKAIHEKLDTLAKLISDDMIEKAENACPAPGTCIGLKARLDAVTATQDASQVKLALLELELRKFERDRAYVLGGAAVITLVLTAVGVCVGMAWSWFLQKSN